MLYRHAAHQIKLLRVKNKVTQEELGEAVDVTRKYISSIENNKKRASLFFYRDVANYFKVTLDYLFIDSSDAKKNIYIDTVNLRMNYMAEEDQRMVMKFVEDWVKKLLKFEKDTQLTREMVDELIERINLSGHNKIEICYKFKNLFEDVLLNGGVCVG